MPFDFGCGEDEPGFAVMITNKSALKDHDYGICICVHQYFNLHSHAVSLLIGFSFLFVLMPFYAH